MPKIKTHSGAKKRFNLTKNGKVKRAHAFKSHILNKKTTKRKRNLRKVVVADATNVAKQVLSQVRGENDEDMDDDDEDKIDYDKCGGKMKKKVAKKACGGKAKKKPKGAKKCEFGGVIENLATTTRMSLINY